MSNAGAESWTGSGAKVDYTTRDKERADPGPTLSIVYGVPPESGAGEDVMEHLTRRWVEKASRHYRTTKVDPGVWVADVVGIEGAWAEGRTRREALANLPSVLDAWVRMKLEDGDEDIPPMDGTKLVVEA